jgi:KaiC/GvpD/RAD55 family RecA-like ATPase
MKRILTHVEGLDEVLGGGIPEGSVVLVSGAPGTMKTSLTYHVLHANAMDSARGLYVSLEQSRASLLDHTQGLGYRLDEVEGKLSILDLGMLRKKLSGQRDQPWMDLFKLYTQGLRKSFDYRLLVLDSLDALEILAKFKEPRQQMFSLIRWLRDLQCTTFLLGELPTDRIGGVDPRRAAYAKNKEDYLADGIVHLRLARQGDFGMQRQLRVVKMRGTRHDTGYHALVFDNGFRVTRILG